MSINLEWGAPPTRAAGVQAQRREIVARLKLRPGKWALVESGARSATVRKSWQSLGVEATTRKTSDGHDVYARWNEPTPQYIRDRRRRGIPKGGTP